MHPVPAEPLFSLLFVDDEQLMGQAFSRVVGSERPDWQVVTATCVADARQALESRRFDATVADIVMPGPDGLSLLRFARQHFPDMLRVVYSGVVEDFAFHGEVQHADLVFAKPALATRIIGALDELLLSGAGAPPRR
jgi:DNA-binding NtrC family response regulator